MLLTIVDGVLSIYEIRKGKRTLTSVLSLIEGEEEKIWDLLGLFGRAKANTPHMGLFLEVVYNQYGVQDSLCFISSAVICRLLNNNINLTYS